MQQSDHALAKAEEAVAKAQQELSDAEKQRREAYKIPDPPEESAAEGNSAAEQSAVEAIDVIREFQDEKQLGSDASGVADNGDTVSGDELKDMEGHGNPSIQLTGMIHDDESDPSSTGNDTQDTSSIGLTSDKPRGNSFANFLSSAAGAPSQDYSSSDDDDDDDDDVALPVWPLSKLHQS